MASNVIEINMSEILKAIRDKAIDDYVTRLLPRLTDAINPEDVNGMTNLIKEVTAELKGEVENGFIPNNNRIN